MTEQVDILVIGAGQAGLCISYYLTQQGHDHLIVEKAPHSVPTWRERWDSFTLVLPNWTFQLPDFPVPEEDKDGFYTREEVIDHFERFVGTFKPRIRFNTEVTSIERDEVRSIYRVQTNLGTIEADHVVVAVGTFQQPRLPAFSANIAPEIVQVHTGHYQNPDALPDGAVLVIGSGQSGCQVAEELYTSGRKVYLSVGSAPPFPRAYRGKDSIWWLEAMGFFDIPATSLESSHLRFHANPVATGKDGGGDLNLHQFARDGVTLLGHAAGADGSVMRFAPDLKETLTKYDDFVANLKGNLDKFIDTNYPDTPPAEPETPVRDGFDAAIIEELDLAEHGITSIVWGTGYRYDYSWIKLPVLDHDEYPIQQRGISEVPGLYFVGLYFMFKRKSGILSGVAADAKHVADHIHAQIVEGHGVM